MQVSFVLLVYFITPAVSIAGGRGSCCGSNRLRLRLRHLCNFLPHDVPTHPGLFLKARKATPSRPICGHPPGSVRLPWHGVVKPVSAFASANDGIP